MFDTCLYHLNNTIKTYGGEEVDIPEDFRHFSSKKNPSEIFSWVWSVPGFRRWRVTRLDAGERLQVLNSVAYPDYNTDKPIMGIDFLWFGLKNKLVAVLDFQPLIQDKQYFDRYLNDLQNLRVEFPDFDSKEKMKAYDPNLYFSPCVLFCRGGLDQAKNTLPKLFNQFLHSYLILDSKDSEDNIKVDPLEVKKLHILYDKYSSKRDPAHGLFISFFGREWSDKYLKEFLFPLSSNE